MLTNETLKLLLYWENNLFAEACLQELMKSQNKSSKAWIFNALNSLIKNNLIVKSKKSNLNLYSLNLNNSLSYKSLNFLKTGNFPEIGTVNILIRTIPFTNYCLIVFGSCAKHKQKKDSDLDVCLITETKEDYKKIKPYVEELKLEINLDVNYVTKKEFVEMLTNEEENLGKQIEKNEKLIFFNEDIYYQMLIEAHKHGYK
ncbi:MAG: nucleotidyltransferase domain-containing protein [Candidatus Nanoarchaeia archaeon]|nr:nucleotidyltransferase domain-containing protein [Candidatus Nanoarchaeia archaeon]